MRPNGTKEKLDKGETVLGCLVQHFRSPEVLRVFAAAGFDYAFIDAEHSGFDLETIQEMIQAAVQSGITPLVRVGEASYSLQARFLDVGAQGIILPRVESPSSLCESISWMKFPPEGKRGYGIMAPVLDYKPTTFQEVIGHLNKNTLTIVQFETRTALERCNELLSIPGVDVAMIGPSDLSISLGVPGEFEHATLIEAIQCFIESCNLHGVIPGIQCWTSALAQPWIKRGMRFIGIGSEHSLLLEKANETVSSMRRECGRIDP
jgi:2-dehydro-3-deoxyglucarate aldolase/4-hydroxy-2-oxoheptanedioate aldolase